MRILYYISFKDVVFLRCLRNFEKWSCFEKNGKNEEKCVRNEENSCPRIPKYTLLTI